MSAEFKELIQRILTQFGDLADADIVEGLDSYRLAVKTLDRLLKERQAVKAKVYNDLLNEELAQHPQNASAPQSSTAPKSKDVDMDRIRGILKGQKPQSDKP